MKYELDQLLQQALSPNQEPSPWLNQKIIEKMKENEKMKRRKPRLSIGIAAVAATLMIASIGVFAGWKYLAPQKVAEEFADVGLAKAFDTEGALFVNETQEYAGIKVTLLGIVSGKGLSEYSQWDEKGQITDDKTYVVTAIENSDGTPMPDVADDAYGKEQFYVSPYINGLSMAEYNAHTLGGGYSEDVIDGIMYRIMECDNIEMFAQRGIYLGVSDGTFFNAEAYHMDDKTGEITRNESYAGVNALFKLPIPAFRGDEEAVEKYLKEREAADTMETEEEALPQKIQDIMDVLKGWSLEDFIKNTECVYEEELTPDSQGYLSYSYELASGCGSEATTLMEMYFEGDKPQFSDKWTIIGEGPTYVETFELLENGNVMLRVFAGDF